MPLDAEAPVPAGAVWLDALNPDDAERRALERIIGRPIPPRERMTEIEPSSRLYRHDGVLFLTAPVVTGAESEQPGVSAATFIVGGGLLVTLRYAEPRPFLLFEERIAHDPSYLDGVAPCLLGLLDAVIDRVADILEMIDAEADGLSRRVFAAPPDRRRPAGTDYGDILRAIGLHNSRTSKVRESLVAMARLLTFLNVQCAGEWTDDQQQKLRTLNRDVKSLTDHTGFLSNKLTFLLDATLGLINIEQNAVVKILSVVAVVFLPPTLIASIYGMNFEVMPELSWPWGYPAALLLMLVSAVVPFGLFKHRGWL